MAIGQISKIITNFAKQGIKVVEKTNAKGNTVLSYATKSGKQVTREYDALEDIVSFTSSKGKEMPIKTVIEKNLTDVKITKEDVNGYMRDFKVGKTKLGREIETAQKQQAYLDDMSRQQELTEQVTRNLEYESRLATEASEKLAKDNDTLLMVLGTLGLLTGASGLGMSINNKKNNTNKVPSGLTAEERMAYFQERGGTGFKM